MNLGEGTPRQFQKGLLQRVSNLMFRIVILFIFVFMKQGMHSIIYYDEFFIYGNFIKNSVRFCICSKKKQSIVCEQKIGVKFY